MGRMVRKQVDRVIGPVVISPQFLEEHASEFSGKAEKRETTVGVLGSGLSVFGSEGAG